MFRGPWRVIPVQQAARMREFVGTERFAELAEVIVKEQGEMFIDMLPPRIVRGRRIGHGEMVDLIRGSENLTREMRMIERSDTERVPHTEKARP